VEQVGKVYLRDLLCFRWSRPQLGSVVVPYWGETPAINNPWHSTGSRPGADGPTDLTDIPD
ncbi:MAG: hypothetical protein ACRECT_05745, partial [Thermoplasmata archaeon]